MSAILDVRESLTHVLRDYIEPLFTDDVRITIIARVPTHPERTLVLSSDDMDAVCSEAVLRSATLPLETWGGRG